MKRIVYRPGMSEREFGEYREQQARQADNDAASKEYFDFVKRENQARLRREAEEEARRAQERADYQRRKDELDAFQQAGRDEWQRQFDEKCAKEQQSGFSLRTYRPSDSYNADLYNPVRQQGSGDGMNPIFLLILLAVLAYLCSL